MRKSSSSEGQSRHLRPAVLLKLVIRNPIAEMGPNEYHSLFEASGCSRRIVCVCSSMETTLKRAICQHGAAATDIHLAAIQLRQRQYLYGTTNSLIA